MIALGDWVPPTALQGIRLERLTGDNYSLRATGICGGLVPDSIPCPGVFGWASVSEVFHATIAATEKQIRGFAKYYNGVAFRGTNGWIIKAIAPKMRTDI